MPHRRLRTPTPSSPIWFLRKRSAVPTSSWGRLHRLGIPFIPVADLAVPALTLGTVVGRLGDMAIVEHLGSPTGFLFAYTVRGGYDLAPGHDALECLPVGAMCGTYHHTALYDLIGAAVLFGVLWWMLRRRQQPGVMFAVWVGWYGLQRFAIDFTQIGNEIDRIADSLTWSQVGGSHRRDRRDRMADLAAPKRR